MVLVYLSFQTLASLISAIIRAVIGVGLGWLATKEDSSSADLKSTKRVGLGLFAVGAMLTAVDVADQLAELGQASTSAGSSNC